MSLILNLFDVVDLFPLSYDFMDEGKPKWEKKKRVFFCVRDRKYPTGLRTNRATDAGYWKAIGKDKEIFRGKSLVGMKTTLLFYEGELKGDKTNWVMQEYRLEGYSRNQEEIIDCFDNPLFAISSNRSDIFPRPLSQTPTYLKLPQFQEM
ncbi:hypothetical protein AAG906_021095 [Vitis piasezkii]